MQEYLGASSGGYDIGTIGLVGSGWLALIGQMVWTKFFNKESKAHEGLIEQLTARIGVLEESHKRLEREIDGERKARREEQSKVHLLELYVVALKAELRRHGIEVPAPVALHDLKSLLGVTDDEEDSDQPAE